NVLSAICLAWVIAGETTAGAQCVSPSGCDATMSFVAVQCTSTGELCDPPYPICVQTGSALDMRFTVSPQWCGSGRLHIFVDNAEVYVTPFLGWPGATGEFASYPLDTGLFPIPVSPGQHTIALQAEGQVSGCNFGQQFS